MICILILLSSFTLFTSLPYPSKNKISFSLTVLSFTSIVIWLPLNVTIRSWVNKSFVETVETKPIHAVSFFEMVSAEMP